MTRWGDKGSASVNSGWYSRQALHGGFQPVHVGEGVFYHVNGCGGLEGVAEETQGCTIHQLSRCTVEVLFDGRANTQQGNWQCFQPVSSYFAHEGCLELALESFDQTVATGVVGSCSDTGDSKEFHQMLPKMGLKLFSSVRSGGEWDAESCDPTKQERLDDHFCTGVGERDDF